MSEYHLNVIKKYYSERPEFAGRVLNEVRADFLVRKSLFKIDKKAGFKRLDIEVIKTHEYGKVNRIYYRDLRKSGAIVAWIEVK